MPIETIFWKRGVVRLIDQRQLPEKLLYRTCRTVPQLWRAIRTLQVRGAPALGVAGALGVVLGVWRRRYRSAHTLAADVRRISRYLKSARPTAVNLGWALERMGRVAVTSDGSSPQCLKQLLFDEAHAILQEDKEVCRRLGRNGLALLKKSDTVLTHCNAGGLATADYGTALGILFAAKARGWNLKVIVDETRPLLQGARLTCWELLREGVDATLIADSMAASLMKAGRIQKVIVGADRIARNGDTANKIGTYSLAVLARAHRIPFIVAAPISTFDFSIRSGREIPIEMRRPDELTEFCGRRVAPKGIQVHNPAFDVTPYRYISAFVTEVGVIKPPFSRSLAKVVP